MISFKTKLSPLFVLVTFAYAVTLFADASLSTDEPGKRVILQIGGIGKFVNAADDFVSKVLPHVDDVDPKEAYDAYDAAGKATDKMNCESDFCTKFSPVHIAKCAGCAVRTVTHPIDTLLKNDDP